MPSIPSPIRSYKLMIKEHVRKGCPLLPKGKYEEVENTALVLKNPSKGAKSILGH